MVTIDPLSQYLKSRFTALFPCLETRLTFEKSYLARLNYVIQNPVKHGLVALAESRLSLVLSGLVFGKRYFRV